MQPQHSHRDSPSKPNTTIGAPDAVLRQPPASSCSFCPINSSFGGYFFPRNENKLCTHPRRPQRRIQTNSRWQAESCVNTTERLSCAHRLLEHAPKLQRSPAALHLFLNLALVGLFKPTCPAVPGDARGTAHQRSQLASKQLHEPGAPSASRGDGLHFPGAAAHGGEKKKRRKNERKCNKSFDHRIFLHLQPTALTRSLSRFAFLQKLLVLNHLTPEQREESPGPTCSRESRPVSVGK